MGCDIIVLDVHAGFPREIMFLTNGMLYNCYWYVCWFSGKTMFWWMGCDIYIYCDEWNCCVYLICVVWRPGKCESQAWKKICMCGMRFIADVAIEDFNWYVVILIIMMILIWYDVVNKDHVNMNWCYCWWLCEYEMRLLLLITSLRQDDIYVENDMEMECWLMLEIHWHVPIVYARGGRSALTF